MGKRIRGRRAVDGVPVRAAVGILFMILASVSPLADGARAAQHGGENRAGAERERENEWAPANAELRRVRLGVRAGISFARFALRGESRAGLPSVRSERRTLPLIGVALEARVNRSIVAESGLDLAVKGQRLTFTDQVLFPGQSVPVPAQIEVRESLVYATVPVRAGIRKPDGGVRPFLLGGPEVSVLLAGRQSSSYSAPGRRMNRSAVTTSRYRRFETAIGIAGGIGVPAGTHRFTVSFRASRGLTRIDRTPGGAEPRVYNTAIHLEGGFWF